MKLTFPTLTILQSVSVKSAKPTDWL